MLRGGHNSTPVLPASKRLSGWNLLCSSLFTTGSTQGITTRIIGYLSDLTPLFVTESFTLSLFPVLQDLPVSSRSRTASSDQQTYSLLFSEFFLNSCFNRKLAFSWAYYFSWSPPDDSQVFMSSLDFCTEIQIHKYQCLLCVSAGDASRLRSSETGLWFSVWVSSS